MVKYLIRKIFDYFTENQEPEKLEYNYSNSYKIKPLLTNNEKRAYVKFKNLADELDMILFTKVRLFDLIEPKSGIKNYKGAMWKIQAKHVDYVMCDKNLSAKIIIELDDSSHDQRDRRERDEFVNTILLNNGYKVVHIRYVTDEELLSIKKFIKK